MHSCVQRSHLCERFGVGTIANTARKSACATEPVVTRLMVHLRFRPSRTKPHVRTDPIAGQVIGCRGVLAIRPARRIPPDWPPALGQLVKRDPASRAHRGTRPVEDAAGFEWRRAVS